MAKPEKPGTLPAADWAKQTWDATHGSYLAGRAHLDGVDHLAAQMELTWGCDRLRLLVPTELRAKFDRQRYRLQQAREGGTLDSVVEECRRMTTALNALDASARAEGAIGCANTVWEVAVKNPEDGTHSVAAIVQDDTAAKDLLAAGRQISVWTLDEIGRLLSAHYALIQAKLTFPGAVVTATRNSVTDPLGDIPRPTSLDDPMPVPLEELA
jgi:hypothetical protein